MSPPPVTAPPARRHRPDRLPELPAVVLRSQLRAAGYDDNEIARLRRAGVFHRIRHGAYVDGPAWRDLDPRARYALRTRAVVRQAKTLLAVSHVSAVPEYGGSLWGFALDDIHVTRTDRRTGRREAGVVQHRGLLGDDDWTMRNGVPVVGPTRAALEVTTVAGVEPSLCFVNYLLRTGQTTLDALDAGRPIINHWPNSLCTRIVLALATDATDSLGEDRLLYLFHRQHVPTAMLQVEVRDDVTGGTYRLDFAWPEVGVWVEFDGRAKYERHRRPGESMADAVMREKRREDAIRRMTGWRCIRLTWADLEHPERTGALVREALGLSRCSAS